MILIHQFMTGSSLSTTHHMLTEVMTSIANHQNATVYSKPTSEHTSEGTLGNLWKYSVNVTGAMVVSNILGCEVNMKVKPRRILAL